LSAIAALTGSLCAFTTVTWSSPAHAVENCAAAPNSAPPQGSHWYYRTDRALQRKCWYLAPQTRKVSKPVRLAPQVQPEPVAPSSMEKVVARPNPPAELGMPETPALPAGESGVTTPEAAPAQGPNPSVDSTEQQKEAASAALAPDYARAEIENPGVPDERPMQQSAAAAGKIKEPAAAPARTLQFVTGGLAAMGFLTSAFLYFAGARRRRHAEVQIVDLNIRAPLRTPATVDSTKPPAAMEMIHRHDELDADIEDRLREFSQAWRRRAA
jgi:hypothetical protein